MSPFTYQAMVLVVGVIAAFDNTMTWIYSDTIVELEQNPVGVWLLERGGVFLFIAVKAGCTLLLSGLLIVLSYTKHRWAVVVAFLWQIVVFAFLNFTTMHKGEFTIQLHTSRWEAMHPINEYGKFLAEFYFGG